MQIFGPPSFFPEWLNDGISSASVAVLVLAVSFLILLILNQRAIIIKYGYIALFGVAVLAFAMGVFFSETESDDLAKRAPLPVDSHRNTTTTQVDLKLTPRQKPDHKIIVNIPDKLKTRVFTPRTPKELMNIAKTETKRDAMRHKGAWIHVEGTVFDVSEVMSRSFGTTTWKSYIELKVAVGPPPYDVVFEEVELYVEAERWKLQVDKIERGDWLMAIGTVHNIYKWTVMVINGEIISVSGSSGGE